VKQTVDLVKSTFATGNYQDKSVLIHPSIQVNQTDFVDTFSTVKDQSSEID
jgi:hypothetical protein